MKGKEHVLFAFNLFTCL